MNDICENGTLIDNMRNASNNLLELCKTNLQIEKFDSSQCCRISLRVKNDILLDRCTQNKKMSVTVVSRFCLAAVDHCLP